jgi:hypothetical protein
LVDEKALEIYLDVMADRPKKLSAEEADYKDAEDEHFCCSCIHWFNSPVRQESTCEIVRPENEDVPPNYTCKFWTHDGVELPKLGINLGEYLKADDEPKD